MKLCVLPSHNTDISNGKLFPTVFLFDIALKVFSRTLLVCCSNSSFLITSFFNFNVIVEFRFIVRITLLDRFFLVSRVIFARAFRGVGRLIVIRNL